MIDLLLFFLRWILLLELLLLLHYRLEAPYYELAVSASSHRNLRKQYTQPYTEYPEEIYIHLYIAYIVYQLLVSQDY